jgi:hypothetical protein
MKYLKLLGISSLLAIGLLLPFFASSWGFFGHKKINQLAVFTLPEEMFGFYKKHIRYLTENAVKPDSRRYIVKGEAPRHYIDSDAHAYGDSAIYKLPRYWKEAVEKLTEDTLMTYGIVPWHIQIMKHRLTEAFKERKPALILTLSAEIGHYIADANVPLHTTENYNGQFTNQLGIHGFWESRLPELYSEEYEFFVGNASYIKNTQLRAWDAVIQANEALDSVFRFEKELTQKMGEDKKWTFDERNGVLIKTYSRDFSKAYHSMLKGQVERRMKTSVKMVGDFWYTCWVDAGQPDLNSLMDFEFSPEDLANEKQEMLSKRDSLKNIRSHDNFGDGSTNK